MLNTGLESIELGALMAQQSGPNMPASWAIVLFCVILGLLVTLGPSKRTSEVKRPKDE